MHNSHHNRFVRVSGDSVDTAASTKDVDRLPPANEWPAERFTVVDAGNEQIALHNRLHNRFVRLIGDSVDAKGGVKDVDQLPARWDCERFTVVILY